MVTIFENLNMIESNGTVDNALKPAFVPATACLAMTGNRVLSRCYQHSITMHVVGEIPQPYFCPGPYFTNTAQDQSPGQHSLHTKDMLNARPYLGPGPVSLLLPFRQLAVFASLALQMPPIFQFFKSLNRLLRSIGRIGIHITVGIVFIQKLLKYLAVMYRCIRYRIPPDKLVLHINTDMILIPVVVLTILFDPAGINIFLPLLGFLPVVRCLPILDYLVFFPTVALLGYGYNTGINNLPPLGRTAVLPHVSLKLLEQPGNSACLCQLFPKQPDGLGIGDWISQVQAQKSYEAHSIKNLVFYRLIRKIIQRLYNQYLKHHHRIVGLCPGIALAVLLTNRFQRGTKPFPLNNLAQLHQWITGSIKPVVPKLPIKKSWLHHGVFLYGGGVMV